MPQPARFWIGIVLIFCGIGLGALALFSYQPQVQESSGDRAFEQTSVAEVVEPVVEQEIISPTPTIAPLDPGAYAIDILNGSGIAGEAGQVRSLLVENDFVVEALGNAEAFDYTETEIRAKESVDPRFVQAVQSLLEQSYVVASSSARPGEEESDIVIIVGSQKP